MTTTTTDDPTTPAASTSPSPSTSSPSEGVKAPGMRVRQQPTPSPTAAAPEGDSLGGASAGGPSPLRDPLADTSTPSSGSEPSADDAPLKLRKKPLADALRGLVLGAGVALHNALARSEYEQQAGVWLMDEDQAGGIADPLANIAGRRAGGQLVNPDAGDLIAAGVAAAGYVIGNAIKAFQIRRAIRSMQRSGVNTETDTREATQ